MEQYLLTQLGEVEGEGGGGKGDTRVGMLGSHASYRNQLNGMQLCRLALRQENMELKSAINGMKMSMRCNFGIANGNV